MIPGTPTPEHQVFRLGIQNAGNPEIAQSGSAGSVQKDIAALEIPMDHSLTVGVLERLGQRPQTREDLLRCPSSKLGDVAAFHMLHGNEDGGWIFMKVEDPDNVRMGQSPGVTAFLPQEGNLLRGGTGGTILVTTWVPRLSSRATHTSPMPPLPRGRIRVNREARD